MSTIEDLDSVLWEFESAEGKPTILEVSLEFWKELQNTKHIRLCQNGDIFYRYIKVVINPKQETNFILY